ncbi:hypothetical protein BpHYR1_003728 [Brachionus plicatilis]|uniref:Uncharacterized protein n=1 Tax=Brachionus plicatilis TaxID=10195 RepID=A0A3M7QSX3_BRAPC|nr:hypothetical protein BpHYR1_003728 [Brachionus plicatilis]
MPKIIYSLFENLELIPVEKFPKPKKLDHNKSKSIRECYNEAQSDLLTQGVPERAIAAYFPTYEKIIRFCMQILRILTIIHALNLAQATQNRQPIQEYHYIKFWHNVPMKAIATKSLITSIV